MSRRRHRTFLPQVPTRALYAFMRMMDYRKGVSTAEVVQQRVAAGALRPPSFAPPRWIDHFVQLERADRSGWICYEVTPRRPVAHSRVVYLHGGGYLAEIRPPHWTLITELARSTGARFTVPIYPLAPARTAATTVAEGTELVGHLVEDEPPGTVTLMGDSSGGGLALAIAQHLVADGVQSLRQLVLIAPWLDATLSHPGIPRIEPLDLILATKGVAAAGEMYAGELPLTDPRVSPLLGEMTGLPPATVFTGSRDILTVDARAFADRARAAGVSVELVEAVDEQHVYPLLPTAKGAAARRRIAELIS